MVNIEPGVLRIHSLGNFRVLRAGETEPRGLGSRHKSWQVLKYLLAKNGTAVSTHELMEIFWPDRGNSGTAPLRTAMSRLKSELDPTRASYHRSSYVICRNDACAFNVQAPYWLDVEEFERQCRAARGLEARDKPGSVELYLQALSLYHGDFLAEDLYQEWTVLPREYYHRLFLDSSRQAALVLIELGEARRARFLLERALAVDPLVEETHVLLMRVLVSLEEFREAVRHYSYSSRLLFEELGVKPSEEIKGLYRRARMGAGTRSEQHIERERQGFTGASGPFLCRPHLFLDLLALESRRALRYGESACLVLLGLKAKSSESWPLSLDDLESAVCDTLRRSDVICRINGRRLSLLLPATDHKGAMVTVSHIQRRLQDRHNGLSVPLQAKIKPIPPTALASSAVY